MATLSHNLLAVIDALPHSTIHNLAIDYRQIVEINADELDLITSHNDGESQIERASRACRAYKILFGENAVTPDSSSYNKEKQSNCFVSCCLPAACFLKLQNTAEVALALKIVTSLQSHFAIRSGGHNSNPGFSGVGSTGIVLDLEALNAITLSAERDLVSVGPGATWQSMYEELDEKELIVVGGRSPGVGVGGLITGGGISPFSNHWGLACDNVKNFEVVLANSTVVQVNGTENPDLFVALKGGGPNFGIVTQFDLYTYPDNRVWYTLKVYNVADAKKFFKASIEVQRAMEGDDRIGFFFAINTNFLVAGMLYRRGTSFPDIFHVFDSMKPIAIPIPETNGTHLSLCCSLNEEEKGKVKGEVGMLTIRIDEDLYLEILQLLQSIVNDNASYSLAIVTDAIGPYTVKKGRAQGGNSLNISPENQSWLALELRWTDDAVEDLARSKLRQLISSIDSLAQSRGRLLDLQYMNFASYTQSPLQSYGVESLNFLQTVSQRWDPNGVFQQLQNSGFLLSKISMS